MGSRRRKTADPAPPPPTARPASEKLARAAFIVALVSMAIYVVALDWYKMSNNDIWIHLKTGELILKNFHVPGNDVYSWNATNHPYVAHEWLAAVFFYLVYQAGGVTGLLLSKIAVVVAIWLLLYDTSRLLGARLSVILPGLGILIYIGTARFLVRPHIFSYLFITIFIWLFFNYRERGRDRRWLYALLAVQVVWVNTHGAWPTGVVLVAVFALGEGLIRARSAWAGIPGDKVVSGRDMAILAALIPADLVANFINPYGWRVITFPFGLLSMDVFMKQIYEWKPPYDPAYHSSTMFFFYLVHLALLCGGFFLAVKPDTRPRAGAEFVRAANAACIIALVIIFAVLAIWWIQPAGSGSGWNAGHLEIALYLLLGLFSLFTLINYRTVDFTQAGLFAFLFLMSLQHNRNVTDAAIGTFPIMTAAVSAAISRFSGGFARKRAGGRRAARRQAMEEPEEPGASRTGWMHPKDPSTPAAVFAGSLLLLAVSGFSATFTYYYDFRGSGREKGFGIARNMPICGVDFIAKHHITGQAFVSYPYASPLIHRMYPEVKVNMDSRNDVYGEELYNEYVQALRDPAAMQSYLQRHRIDFFFLANGDRNPAVFAAIEKSGEWAAVYMDNRGFVMVRRTPENASFVRENEFHYIQPPSWGSTPVNPGNASAILTEAERAIQDCPSSGFGYLLKARADYVLRRYDDAIAACQSMIALSPDNAELYSFMGGILEADGKPARAREMYERALSISPGLSTAQQGIERLRGF
ncbi:MAG TPA: tetratricopeptide repeat protein [Candidatus Saccharimonadales bacterium]|nr:tetratricopeptide repeat protein [Candidatus Saccharimonadales bacterium]